jgi:coenzyme PQQ synthesis protein D (PqqD)
VRWREIDGEVVAIDLDASTYLSTNESGVHLWRRLAEGTTREELVIELVQAFGIEREQAETDVDHFVEELRSRNLLET